MSAAAAGRVGRYYTSARRHPWVLGKVADWRIPLGPYTPAQIAAAVLGGFLLVKTIPLWSWMGPVPIVAWLLVVWAVRRPKFKGLSPVQAAVGWVLLAGQPQGGRIRGRAARDRSSRLLVGGFTVEDVDCAVVPAVAPPRAGRPAPGRAPRRRVSRLSALRRLEPKARPVSVRPVSGVEQLLALAEQGGAR
ncbi:hypothetical protein ACIOJ9_38930 [Streptomyces sp. NPDC088175]|uniref:hypothetical protein n=1 Tax=unclassified Streptomyces TaxID=2593676 RepID=UPI0037F5B81A